MFEITSLIIAIAFNALTLAGAPESESVESLDPCEQMHTADACLALESCDMFRSAAGSTCATACDERGDEMSCSADSACAWQGGACTYHQTVPGC